MIDIVRVTDVAQDTRADFEVGRVGDREILDAAGRFGATFPLSTYIRDQKERSRRIEAGTLTKVDFSYVELPIIGDNSNFPKGFCNITTPVLAARLDESGLLDNRPEIIHGGCEENPYALDKARYYHNYHAFVGIGYLAIGSQRVEHIVDITADQFDTGLPSVYVGPLVHPWTRHRLEEW